MQNDTPAERLRSLLPQIFVPQRTEGDLFVQLQLTPQVVVSMPLASVAEVTLVMVPEITPIPNMPDSILGLFNAKGYVFWLLDLAHFLGFGSTLSQLQRYEMIMVHSDTEQHERHSDLISRTSDQFLGLAIQHVQGSLRISSSEIRSSDMDRQSTVPPELTPYTDAYISHNQGFFPILSVEKIKKRLMSLSHYT